MAVLGWEEALLSAVHDGRAADDALARPRRRPPWNVVPRSREQPCCPGATAPRPRRSGAGRCCPRGSPSSPRPGRADCPRGPRSRPRLCNRCSARRSVHRGTSGRSALARRERSWFSAREPVRASRPTPPAGRRVRSCRFRRERRWRRSAFPGPPGPSGSPEAPPRRAPAAGPAPSAQTPTIAASGTCARREPTRAIKPNASITAAP